MRLAAGLGIALALGAAGGGWWLPAGALVAGLLALCAPRVAVGGVGGVAAGPGTPTRPSAARVLARLGLGSRLSRRVAGDEPPTDAPPSDEGPLPPGSGLAREAPPSGEALAPPSGEAVAPASGERAVPPASGARREPPPSDAGPRPPRPAARRAFRPSATTHLPPRAVPLLTAARTVARLALVPVFASACGTYLLPQYRVPVALAVVVIVAAGDGAGAVLPRFVRGWVLGILLVGAAGLVALCLAIAPERGVGSGPGFAGIFAAAAVLFPLLTRQKPDRWLAGTVVVAAVLCAVALHQLGPVRLGLSDAPLRDLLAAVDGQAIEPLLAGIVVIATVPAALGALTGARGALPRPSGSLLCGLLAAAGAVFLTPAQALLVAAALALAEVLVTSLLTLPHARSVVSAALAITLLAWFPGLDLLLALAVLALGVLVVRRPAAPRAA
ncbi:hypothetical protein [Amycolatopsis dongchuanensis]|uniref:Integral membrane protein n=1 Tax=Amycolatopsis dongchuanensis TaxID=1070866 RepID=A0ABP8VAW0_9PSEU